MTSGEEEDGMARSGMGYVYLSHWLKGIEGGEADGLDI